MESKEEFDKKIEQSKKLLKKSEKTIKEYDKLVRKHKRKELRRWFFWRVENPIREFLGNYFIIIIAVVIIGYAVVTECTDEDIEEINPSTLCKMTQDC